MKNQTEINSRMRAIIVNWIIDVHDRFKLLPDTLFLSVIIFDRYMSIINNIDKNKNIGFVSSKFFYIPIGNILPEDNEMLWDLKEKLGIKSNLNYFLAGTMFMIKSNLLEIIKKSEIKEDDFPQKSASNGNSTIAHTIERIFAMICDMNKNEIYLIKTNKYYWKYLQIYFENTIKEIFSIRNSDDKKHKILTILGIKISFNR